MKIIKTSSFYFFLFFALVTFLLSWTLVADVQAVPGSTAQLKQSLAGLIRNKGLPQEASCGVCVKDLGTGRVIYSYNGATPMVPASNLKVVTTSVAWEVLPADIYKVQLLGGKADSTGTVKGNLYLRGNGMPTLTPPYIPAENSVFDDFARNLCASGVRCIAGDLVADDSAFDRQYVPQGWKDDYLLEMYAAPVSALSSFSNLVEVIIGDSITLNPPTCTIPVEDKRGAAENVAVNRKRGSDTMVITGSGSSRRHVTVNNPPMYTLGIFKGVLDRYGIKINGKLRLIDPLREGLKAHSSSLVNYGTFKSAQPGSSYEPITVHEIIKETNYESDNLFAEHLFRTLGYYKKHKGTAANSFAVVKEFLQSNGLDTTGLYMVDGCGLSRLNRIAPCQLAGVLEIMNRRAPAYKESLPTGGRGTLWGRLGGLNLRAKTGTLDRDSTLSGYVTTAAGQKLVFSVMVNDCKPTWQAVELEDDVVQLLAGWGEKV